MDIIAPNATKEAAMSSLYWCAKSRELALLKSILAVHFSTCAISDLQRECLQVLRQAVISGCKETLTSLLDYVDKNFLLEPDEVGVKEDITNGRARVDRLLGFASEHGQRDVAEVLITYGAKVCSTYCGKSLLHLSCSLGHLDLAALLIQKGADVNGVDRMGETSIFTVLASGTNNMGNIVELLITSGADLWHCNVLGRQPIHIAAMVPDTMGLARLIKAGCDVSAQDLMGDTPLHHACTRCHKDAILMLVEHGANINAINKNKITPLRKLLKHATCASKDFHTRARLNLAQELLAIGFRADQYAEWNRHKLAGGDKEISVKVSLNKFNSTFHLSGTFQQQNCNNASEKDLQSSCSPLGRFSARGTAFIRDKVYDILRVMSDSKTRVPVLQHLCRIVIRQNLPTTHFTKAVACLELPHYLQKYLMFKV